jgi:predicted permease
MQTPMLAGRDFTEHDNLNASRVVIINQTTARKHWPNGDAIGRRIVAGRPGDGQIAITVVGIVHDVKQSDWQALPDEELYFPFLQSRDFSEDAGGHVSSMWFVVRTATDPSTLAPAIENAIHGIDRTVLVSGVTTMDHAIAQAIWRQRLSLSLLGIFAMVALALAVTGIYGVISHSIAQRTQELGIRIALGAGRGAILRLAVRQGMVPVWIGSAVGLGLALALGHFMSAVLFEVKPADPVTLAGVEAVLALAGLLANWQPALRAARVDPLTALRDE